MPEKLIVQATALRPQEVVSPYWARSLAMTKWPFNVNRGFAFATDQVGGESAEKRNQIVASILQRDDVDVTDIAWLDDDVIPFSPLYVRALLAHDADIRSGVYFSREEIPQPLIFPGKGQGTAPFSPGKVYRDHWGGMGLTLVRAGVYRKMLDAGLPLDKYGHPEWYKTVNNEHEFTTDDQWFLRNAVQMGCTTVVDAGRHAFGFHCDLATRRCYPETQWGQYMRGEPLIWETAEGQTVWA